MFFSAKFFDNLRQKTGGIHMKIKNIKFITGVAATVIGMNVQLVFSAVPINTPEELKDRILELPAGKVYIDEAHVRLTPGNMRPEHVEILRHALENPGYLITELELVQCDPKIFRSISEVLKDNSTLKKLSLVDCSINAEDAKLLSEILKTKITLTTLNLSCNNIGVLGAQYISEALKTNRTLTTLDLSFSDIGILGTHYISEALKINRTLTTLDLSYNNIGDLGAQHISKALQINGTLTTLGLTGNYIETLGGHCISEALDENSKTTLTTLDLAQNDIATFKIPPNSELTTLFLGDNNIRGDGVRQLAEKLSNNTTLTSLNISGNGVPENMIVKALRNNTTITQLSY